MSGCIHGVVYEPRKVERNRSVQNTQIFSYQFLHPIIQFNQEIAKHENRTSKMNFAAQEDKANDVLNVDEFNNGIQSQVREIDWLKSHQSFHFFVVASKRGGFG